MTTFRLDIHICAGHHGNLADNAGQYPVRESLVFEAADNAYAMDWAVSAIAQRGQPGDVGVVSRQDGDTWTPLGEVHQ